MSCVAGPVSLTESRLIPDTSLLQIADFFFVGVASHPALSHLLLLLLPPVQIMNKDEALKCGSIGARALQEGDIPKAIRFFERALRSA